MKGLRHSFLPGLVLFALVLPKAAGAAHDAAEQLFVARIQPLLKTKCLACHGDDEAKIKGGLDLRTQASMLVGGDR